MDKSGGPSVGADLKEGRYEIPADHGPRRGGKYRVEISSVDSSASVTEAAPEEAKGNPMDDPAKALPSARLKPLSGGGPIFRDRVPPAYNFQSQLTLSVPEDAAKLQKDFDLHSKTKP
jgi:hypothetical protein